MQLKLKIYQLKGFIVGQIQIKYFCYLILNNILDEIIVPLEKKWKHLASSDLFYPKFFHAEEKNSDWSIYNFECI